MSDDQGQTPGEVAIGALTVGELTPGELTLAEKASLCSGTDFWRTQPIERVGIESRWLSDGPHGLRNQAGEADHLAVEASERATCFPPAAALASSWDRDLARRVGAAIATEARTQGVSVVLGPGINIKRSPLCGRNFEYLSEDPVLAGELATAYVHGVQQHGVGTSLKHFAANNQETDRLRVSAEVDERTLREIYLAAFERVVTRAAPWTVMCSYNKINGTYASEDRWLLTDLLRTEWGFDGLVMSDWGAVNDRVAGVAAGLDLEMPASGGLRDAEVVAAVQAGVLDEADLDRTVARVLQLHERTAAALAEGGRTDEAAHHTLAREVAARCAVLLKNDDQLLPLSVDGGPLAVIGEFARAPRFQGGGSSRVNPTRLDNVVDELTALGADVRFAAGYALDDDADGSELITEAVATARGAATTVLFLGLPNAYESEGYDRTHLELPSAQLSLLEAITEVTERVVVVLTNGSVVRVSGWQDRVGAILEGWLLGQAGAGALADLLLGVRSPSGRLAETIPVKLSDCAAQLNFPGERGTVRYGEGLFVGYRQYDAQEREVSYPFGHGLGYTTFALADLQVQVGPGPHDAESASVVTGRAEVTNTGDRAGVEVVQVYVADPEASVVRPVRELKAFETVSLEAGESSVVEFTLTGRDLAYWLPGEGWTLESGKFEICVGRSSRDLPLRAEVTVAGTELAMDLDAESSIAEWSAHPVGGTLLRDRLGAVAAGLLESSTIDVIGSMPLARFARFPGSPLDHAGFLELFADWEKARLS